MKRVKTPRDAKGPEALKLIKRTASSVYGSRMPARSARHMRHSHTLIGARQIVRIDRQEWEERVASILHILEEHRYGRANALYSALNAAVAARLGAEKKTAEVETFAEELQASNEEMRATNEEMRAINEEMRVVSEELEHMHVDLERFVPVAEAELHHPLEKMQARAAELAEKLGDRLDDEERAELAAISGDAGQMAGLVQEVIAYWRPGAEALGKEPVDLEQVLVAVEDGLGERVGDLDAELTADPLPTVPGDRFQLETLLRVLVANSLRFCGDAAPKIHIAARRLPDKDLEVAGAEEARGWLLTVEDNGVGMTDEQRRSVFVMFGAAHGERSGRGLGLATAWKIVRRMGGRIWIDPDREQGCAVYVLLPEETDE